MNEYKFKIQDYHAIKSASIDLNGITVLAGENGSGKSTIAKWLYYSVDGAINFDKYALKTFRNEIENYLSRLYRAYRDINGSIYLPSNRNLESGSYFYDLLSMPANDNDYVSKYHNMVSEYAKELSTYIEKHKNSNHLNIGMRIERIKRYLDIPKDMKDKDDICSYFVTSANSFLDNQIQQLHVLQEERNKSSFYDFIRDEFRETDPMPQHMELDEEGVNLLLSNKVGHILNIDRVIYIDTPMTLRGSNESSPFWHKLSSLLVNKDHSDRRAVLLLHRISRILQGKAVLSKNKITEYNELHYKREDGLDIPLEKTATGFRAFAYLQMLLENGYLNEGTMLLIDEPEAHLHPQWIVEYARLLVQLYKTMGVKIMIASHNPDMVSAIYNISKKEEIGDFVSYYLSKESKEEYKYDFINQEGKIEGIFKSFNIALDRINEYGGLNEKESL